MGAAGVLGVDGVDGVAGVAGVEGVGEVVVTLTWTPPWTPDQMSDDAKMALDFF